MIKKNLTNHLLNDTLHNKDRYPMYLSVSSMKHEKKGHSGA